MFSDCCREESGLFLRDGIVEGALKVAILRLCVKGQEVMLTRMRVARG